MNPANPVAAAAAAAAATTAAAADGFAGRGPHRTRSIKDRLKDGIISSWQ